MAEGAYGEEVAAVGGEACVDVPTESACAAVFRNLTRSRHLGDSERREYSDAAVLAAVHDHLAKDGEVVGGREESCVARDAAHTVRGRVVNFSAQNALALASLLASPSEIALHPAHVLRGRDARQQFRARTETGIAHAQRLVDFAARELVERHA